MVQDDTVLQEVVCHYDGGEREEVEYCHQEQHLARTQVRQQSHASNNHPNLFLIGPVRYF